MSRYRVRAYRGRRHNRGLTLIELMIALMLGLLVVGGAIGIFISNRQTYRTTESLGRIQENGRVAFELMAREIREAGGNPCGKSLPVADVLNPSADAASGWWRNVASGLIGYENGALAGSAAGTDAIDLISADAGSVTVTDELKEGASNSAEFKVTDASQFKDNEVIMVCDYDQISVLQITNVNGMFTVVANTGSVEEGPGNCTHQLGFPVVCGGAGKGNKKFYGANSQVAKLRASRWYVADNGRGGRSLYRVPVTYGVPRNPEEIAEGVQNMQLTYVTTNGTTYQNAPVAWPDVEAVRIVLTLQGVDRAGTGNTQLVRNLSHVVALRSRAP